MKFTSVWNSKAGGQSPRGPGGRLALAAPGLQSCGSWGREGGSPWFPQPSPWGFPRLSPSFSSEAEAVGRMAGEPWTPWPRTARWSVWLESRSLPPRPTEQGVLGSSRNTRGSCQLQGLRMLHLSWPDLGVHAASHPFHGLCRATQQVSHAFTQLRGEKVEKEEQCLSRVLSH